MDLERQQPLKPLIAVVGATGTGKSQLAVEIARQFDGEIINGDAMQLYHGLPVITNKIPLEEQKGIPHHLLGCIGLNEPTWDVSKFVPNALRVIDEIHARRRLPILVGGTHYYTQSLLFHDSNLKADENGQDGNIATGQFQILQQPTEAILAKLREVDPTMADRWHPNDRRKIQRSLEIWLQTGKTASQTYTEQLGLGNGHSSVAGEGGIEQSEQTTQHPAELHFPTLLFWVHADRQSLHSRLDSRVLDMVRGGLLDEVKMLDDFLVSKRASGERVDRSRGIWVSIGYKEFEDWVFAQRQGSLADQDLERLQALGTEATQAATRQYSNRQSRWIRIKLLNALQQASSSETMFLLDGTDISRFEDNVVRPALDITRKFLDGDTLPRPTSLSLVAKDNLVPTRADLSKRPDLWVRKTCDVCDVTAVTVQEWEKHVRSGRHKKSIVAKRKQESQILSTARS